MKKKKQRVSAGFAGASAVTTASTVSPSEESDMSEVEDIEEEDPERFISHQVLLSRIRASGNHKNNPSLPYLDMMCGHRKFYVQQDVREVGEDGEERAIKNPLWLNVVRGLGVHGGSSFSNWTFHKYSLKNTLSAVLQNFRVVKTRGEKFTHLATFRMRNGSVHEDDAFRDLLELMKTSWGTEGYTALLGEGGFRPAISPDGELRVYSSDEGGELVCENVTVELKCASTCKIKRCNIECKELAETFKDIFDECREEHSTPEEAFDAALLRLENETIFDPNLQGVSMIDDRTDWEVFCKRQHHFKAYPSIPGYYVMQMLYEMYSQNTKKAVLGSRGANGMKAWFLPYDRLAHLCGALFQRALARFAEYVEAFAFEAMALDLNDITVEHSLFELDPVFSETVSDILLAADIDTGKDGEKSQGYALRAMKRHFNRVCQLKEQMQLFIGFAGQGEGGGRMNKKGFTKLSKDYQKAFGRTKKVIRKKDDKDKDEGIIEEPTRERVIEDFLRETPFCHKRIDFERPDPTELAPLTLEQVLQKYNQYDDIALEEYILHAIPWFLGPTFKLKCGENPNQYWAAPLAEEVRVEALVDEEGHWNIHVRVGQHLDDGTPWKDWDETKAMQDLKQQYPDAHILTLPENWREVVNDDELVFDQRVLRRLSLYGELFGYDAYSFTRWRTDRVYKKPKAPPSVWFKDAEGRIRYGFDGHLDNMPYHDLKDVPRGTLVTVVLENIWETNEGRLGGAMIGVIVHGQELPPYQPYTQY